MLGRSERESKVSTLESTGKEGLEILKKLISEGQFHHATYRDKGTIWEGLWIYRKSETGRRGFEVAGCIPGRVGEEFCGGTRNTNRPELDEAYRLIDGGRLSVGAYGEG